MLLPFNQRGAKILEEGIAQRANDIDVVYIYGYAFPVAKGVNALRRCSRRKECL